MIGKACYREINRLLEEQLDKKNVLIAVHRGTWGGNIIENTIPAYKMALSMGADLFECDVAMSTDGIIYTFHDGGEPRLLGEMKNIRTISSEEIDKQIYKNSIGEPSGVSVGRLEEVFTSFTHHELFNIDRGWDFLPQIDALMCQYPKTIRQAIIKTPVKDCYLEFFQNCPTKYMYMPIAYSMEDVKKALAWSDINIVGVELIARTKEEELFQKENIHWIKEQDLYVWVNAITLSNEKKHVLFGGLNDDTALLDNPNHSWGKLFEMGVNVIQTDWPVQLQAYRKRYFNL